MNKLFIFNEETYIEYLFDENITIDGIQIQKNDESFDINSTSVNESINYGEIILNKESSCKILILSNTCKNYKKTSDVITISNKNCDIILGIKARIAFNGNKIVNEDSFEIYVNGQLFTDKIIQYTDGDHILIYNKLFVFHDTYIKVYSEEKLNTTLIEKQDGETFFEGYPEYTRSPRVIKRLKDDKINLLKPAENESRKKGSLAKVILPPLVMVCVSAGSAVLMGRGIFVLVSIIGTLATLIFSVTTFFSENKELKEKNAKRAIIYEKYLLETRKILDNLKQNEIEALNYNNPTIRSIETMVDELSPRIYERDVNDDDFLTVCIGRRTDKAQYTVALDYNALSTEKDPLVEEAKQMQEDYQYIENKAILIDMKKAHIGIVGEKKDVHKLIMNTLAQLTFFQSYHNVEIIMLYNSEFANKFDYIRWYPHVKLHSVNLTGNINTERVRDQVLGSLFQVLKDRRLKREENKREMSYFPHYVIIVDDYHLIMNHSIMEYLQEDTTDLGFTLVYTAQKRANLPENIKTVIIMEDSNTATLLLNEGEETNKKIDVDKIENIDTETMARNLNSLIHKQGVSAQIPSAITYFDMYKVTKPEELNIRARWEKGETHKSLAVPLGVRAEDDYVELNLHERAHGPHGLVAGTTGSGKSEIVQAYILSLATNFSPYEVAFLLIDYKGGGMANLFKNLPHLLGTITNLDGAESMRALASIKAESQRRQRIFSEHNVNNINKYNKLFRSGKAKEPLPHLFIISDEFAELKQEQPEFMKELVSVARIGRTLGFHLILATQKPSGVVDDQIWSNSKFKLALMVQNEADSKEIIKTPDAAFLTTPGRAYLQVGNNEIYELFQSAYSGALYTGKEEANKVDDRIYQINALGQAELINKDLSSSNDENETMYTQLDAVIDHIHDIYESEDHLEVTKTWMPSLKDKIVSPYINVDGIIDTATINDIDISVNVGLVDIPEMQAQDDYCVNFVDDGNLAIFASSGFGKSTTLGTIISSLAVKNNPKYMNFYILDFGNSSLIPFKNLPHTSDYMNFDSNEKLGKFSVIIQKEIKERKRLMGQAMAQNFDMYNKMNPDNKMKAIFICIDNYDVVKEISMEFEDFLSKASRDGAGLGIYTVVTATRVNAIRYATLNNFKEKIAQYMFDNGDVLSLIGKSSYALTEKKGRALIKRKLISMMQVYTPVDFEEDVDYMENLKSLIAKVKDTYTGHSAIGIPVLPEVFTTKDYSNYAIANSEKDLIGLNLDNVELVSANITAFPYIILGPVKSGKTNFLEILMNQDKGIKYLFDSSSLDLFKYKNNEEFKYISNEDDSNDFMGDLMDEISTRRKGLDQALANEDVISPIEYISNLPNWTVYIDDVDTFMAKMMKYTNLVPTFKEAADVGIRIIITATSSNPKGFDDASKYFKSSNYGAVLGNQGSLNLFSLPSIKDTPTFGNAVLCDNGLFTKVKLPKYMGF
ncbi:MAG: type VII secretion protein EssC [Erysipelotrichaceae bacterium]